MGKRLKQVEREGRTERPVEAYVLTNDGREIPVVITNVSNCGCLIKAGGDFASGEQVRIEVPRLGGIWAQIRWAADGDAGAEFVPGSDLWEPRP